MNKTRAKQLLKKFEGLKIAVLGDMVLDEYVYGESTRISREAPVLILRHERSDVLPGGGANPVSNIQSLGGAVHPVGVVGDDRGADLLEELFRKKGVDTSGLIRDRERETQRKVRLMAGGHNTARQQIVRLDYVSEEALPPTLEARVLAALERALTGADGLLVSDYGSGLVTAGVLKVINSLAQKKPELVTVVDSRYQLNKYRGVWAAVPNETEAAPAAGFEEYREAMLNKIGEKLLGTLKSRMVLVTRGSKGMSLYQKGKRSPSTVPVYGSTRIVDVNGAGDTVAAAMTLALAAGANGEEAMALANAAGGVAVMHPGPASVTAKQLMKNLEKYL